MLRRLLPLWPAVALGLAFFALTKFIRRTPITPRELRLDQALTARAPAGLVDLSHAVNVQVWIFVVLALVVCLLLMRHFRQALLLLLAEPLAEAINLALKIAINREMPDQSAVSGLERLNVLLFPSGHVVRVTVSLGVFVAFVAWPNRRLRWPATAAVMAFIALVGVTQTTVGGHLPLDVVGGFLLGGVIVNVVYVADRALSTPVLRFLTARPSGQTLPSPRVPASPSRTQPARVLPVLVVCGAVLVAAVGLRGPQKLWRAASSTPALSPTGLIDVAAERAAALQALLGRAHNKVAPG